MQRKFSSLSYSIYAAKLISTFSKEVIIKVLHVIFTWIALATIVSTVSVIAIISVVSIIALATIITITSVIIIAVGRIILTTITTWIASTNRFQSIFSF